MEKPCIRLKNLQACPFADNLRMPDCLALSLLADLRSLANAIVFTSIPSDRERGPASHCDCRLVLFRAAVLQTLKHPGFPLLHVQTLKHPGFPTQLSRMKAIMVRDARTRQEERHLHYPSLFLACKAES